MRVLVTDGATNKSLAVVRSAGEYASFVGVTSAFPVSVAGCSRYADARYWLRDRSPGAYVDRLNSIARREAVDQLLPVGGRTFEVVSEYRDELRLPVEELLPSKESMRTAIDKRATYDLAERLGVPAPTTTTVASVDDLATVPDRIGLPAVLKTGRETDTRFVEVVTSEPALEAAYRAYREVNDADPLVQEYLPGTGRGYFAFYVEGELVDGYAHRRIREYPPEGGASACAGSKRDDELRGYADSLLSELDWHGVAMVEFKEAGDGVPKVVEINPKFWGSLDLAIESGFDLPRALLEYTEGKRTFEFEFTPRCVNWPLSGDLTHAWRRPSSAPDVLEDLLSVHVRSNVRYDDPAPHLVEAMVTLLRRDI